MFLLHLDALELHWKDHPYERPPPVCFCVCVCCFSCFFFFFFSFFLKPFAAVLLLLLFSPFLFACSIGIVLGMQCECCSNSMCVILLKTTCDCRRTPWQCHAGPVGQVASRWSRSTPHPHCPTAAPRPKYQVSALLLLLLCFFSSAPCPRYTSAQCLCSLASVFVSSCSSAPSPRCQVRALFQQLLAYCVSP